MQEYVVFSVLGLGAGAVGAALGIGLVMTYRGAGVINFAHAAIAIWGAFAFHELRDTGHLILPVPWLGSTLALGEPPSVAFALTVAVALAAALGAAVQLLVFRPLRHAPLIAAIIASLGLMLLFQNLVIMKFGREPRWVEPILPNDPVTVGELAFPADRLWLAGIVVCLALAIAVVYRRTIFGTATRAGLEDEVALTLCGRSPTMLAVINVGLGTGVTTLVMILAAPTIPLNVDAIPLLVVPGLTAMLVGRLSSVIAAAGAGLALGVLQADLTYSQTQEWWPTALSTSGLTEAAPLVVIIIVLAFGGRSLPTRGNLVSQPMPRVPAPMRMRTVCGWTAALAVVAVLVGPPLRLGLNQSIVFAILALSLVVLVGLAGQISLGQLAVAGIAAFMLSHTFDTWPFPSGLIVASMAAAGAAVIVGLPALRVRGAQLAVVTLAGAAAVQAVVFSDATSEKIEPPTIAGISLASQEGDDIARLSFTFVLLAILTLVCVSCSIMIGGRLGRRFMAVRNNEQAAASIGVRVALTKVTAMGIAGFIAGLGGGLLAYSNQAISGASFGVFASVTLLIYAYLGGITSIGGALYAGAIVPAGIFSAILSERWNLANSNYETVAALGLIVVAIANPNGIVDASRRVAESARRRRGASPAHPAATVPRPAVGGEVSQARRARLEATRITVRYGGLTAVEDADIRVEPGELIGLIGPNGAGKTSLLDALTGFTASDGSVSLGGRQLEGMSPHARYRAGLARTWQSGQLFDDLTVADNVRVAAIEPRGARTPPRPLAWTARQQMPASGAAAMQMLGVTELGPRLPSELSGGQRKLVDLARSLAGSPSILLADEPAAGLDSFESQLLGESLQKVAAAGLGILLIEHDLAMVLRICDRVYVLDQGRIIAIGTPDQIRDDPEVLKAYVGEDLQPEETS